MKKLITELKIAGHVISDDQQIQTVFRSLPYSWEHMKVNLIHNKSNITFDVVSRYFELEDDALRQLHPLEMFSWLNLFKL